MGWGDHHLQAYDPDIGRSREFTAEELELARRGAEAIIYRESQVERKLLERLVDLGNKFRNTPIVDEEFPTQRDNFDRCLAEATEYLRNKRQGNRDGGSS